MICCLQQESDYQFSIGKQVFDQEKYDELVPICALQDMNFNPDSKFFPLYRTKAAMSGDKVWMRRSCVL